MRNLRVLRTWRQMRDIFKNDLYDVDLASQWFEHDELPLQFLSRVHRMCTRFFPVKTKAIQTLELVLEQSLISAIHAQLPFLSFDYSLFEIIENAVYKCFDRIEHTQFFFDASVEYLALWHATKKIQKNWRVCISNPAYTACRNRLMWEFTDLSTTCIPGRVC